MSLQHHRHGVLVAAMALAPAFAVHAADFGPCTSPGTPHHYTSIIVATDLDTKDLPPGLSREELLAKITPGAPSPSRAKGTAGLVGLFVTPPE